MPDKRALKTLFERYWSPEGWRRNADRATSSEDFAYAKRAGVMFDPESITHDAAWRRLCAARDSLSTRPVADAFLASLSTRRLELRSALGSYAVFRNAAPHAVVDVQGRCLYCGLRVAGTISEDLNVLNFERFKWGGVRHHDPIYAAVDLELFLKETTPVPTLADIEIFRLLLSAIEKSPAESTAATLESRLAHVFKSNKAERDVVVAVLGFCGILETADHPGYRTRFIPADARCLPGRRFVDMPYPVCWWRRSNGICHGALRDYFGHVL